MKTFKKFISEQSVAEGVSLKQKHEDKKRADQNQVRYGKMTQAEFDKKWTRTERPKPTDKEQGMAESTICTNCDSDPCICDDSHGFVQEGTDQKKPTLPPHLLKLIKDKQLDKKPMSQTSKVKDVTPKGYGPNEETNTDKFKKYVRPVVKTTPKIERDTNPSGRTNDHVEWKVTTHTGEVHRHKTKKEAQAHFDSLPK
jgi:hypothetical protein